jgi:hypothetical protein
MGSGVLIISDFSANYPGAFVRSLESLGHAYADRGSIAYLFPRARAWQDLLRSTGSVFVSKETEWGRMSPALTREVLRICTASSISLVHTNFGMAAPLAATAARRLLGTKHLWHWRSTPNSLSFGTSSPRTRALSAPIAYRHLAGRRGIVHIAISSPLRGALVAQRYLHAGKVRVLRNAIDLSMYVPPDSSRTAVSSLVGVDLSDRPIIGFVGHLEHREQRGSPPGSLSRHIPRRARRSRPRLKTPPASLCPAWTRESNACY